MRSIISQILIPVKEQKRPLSKGLSVSAYTLPACTGGDFLPVHEVLDPELNDAVVFGDGVAEGAELGLEGGGLVDLWWVG